MVLPIVDKALTFPGSLTWVHILALHSETGVQLSVVLFAELIATHTLAKSHLNPKPSSERCKPNLSSIMHNSCTNAEP